MARAHEILRLELTGKETKNWDGLSIRLVACAKDLGNYEIRVFKLPTAEEELREVIGSQVKNPVEALGLLDEALEVARGEEAQPCE